ncbi:hypothetical protein RHGRI_029355 [Rhododendron griersonianum]|uniref:Uncharacterized protein n=1 Tax=Rhododendron griersonianum TaxID=479676 RepID=A0AAV6IMH2_9ERIC|nr:hypothetical protein RHGRI_029355 [Rhododendron griersonianum]
MNVSSDKIQLWRSRNKKSDLNFDDFYPPKAGSIYNSRQRLQALLRRGPLGVDRDGGDSQGVELLPPVTAKQKRAVLAKERGSSILEEYLTVGEARAKGYKSRVTDRSLGKSDSLRHSQRHSNGGPRLLSCFAYGFEFTEQE